MIIYIFHVLFFFVVLAKSCDYKNTTTFQNEMDCQGFECLKNYVDKDDGAFSWSDTGKRLNGNLSIYLSIYLSLSLSIYLSLSLSVSLTKF